MEELIQSKLNNGFIEEVELLKSVNARNGRFGNVCFDAKTLDVESLYKVLKSLPYDDNTQLAIIIDNLPFQLAEYFYKVYFIKITYQYTRETGETIHVLRRGCNIPEILDHQIYAAGVVILIRYENDLYSVYHKDKTKSMLTLLGGTVNREEYMAYKDKKMCFKRSFRRDSMGFRGFRFIPL